MRRAKNTSDSPGIPTFKQSELQAPQRPRRDTGDYFPATTAIPAQPVLRTPNSGTDEVEAALEARIDGGAVSFPPRSARRRRLREGIRKQFGEISEIPEIPAKAQTTATAVPTSDLATVTPNGASASANVNADKVTTVRGRHAATYAITEDFTRSSETLGVHPALSDVPLADDRTVLETKPKQPYVSTLKLGTANILASEWTKFRSLKSSWLAPVITIGILILLTLPLRIASDGNTQIESDWPLGLVIMAKLLAFGLISPPIIAITSEFPKVGISTFSFTPQRWRPIAAKVAVTIPITMAVTFLTIMFCGVGFILTTSAKWTTMLITIAIGCALATAFICLFAQGLALLTRSTAASLVITMGLMLLGDLPSLFIGHNEKLQWLYHILCYSLNATTSALSVWKVETPYSLIPLIISSILWLAIPWVSGLILLYRRDI